MQRSQRPLLLLTALGLVACQDTPTSVRPMAPTPVNLALAPVKAQGIPGQYIVVFSADESDVPGRARQLVAAHRGNLLFTYDRAIKGFAARIPDAAIDALRRAPGIVAIEQDQVIQAETIQSPATWGIDRSDQRDLPLSGTYEYTADGSGVKVYIIDTGIRFDHSEFGGRASTGYDAVTIGGTAADCNGHGTHVAGTVGGATYGMAKKVSLVAVRVLGCTGSGSTSGVIAGVDWVASDHAAGQPAAANMSLGGGISSTLDQAVANAIADGVTFGVAAGNSNVDACGSSPARVASALTVGSTTSTDARSSFSNFGTCVDLFAPGSSITSSWYTSATATNTISGTSMATPHVVGAAALYLQTHAAASPAEVASAVLGSATAGKVGGEGAGSPDLLLYTGSGAAPPPPPPPPVNASPVARYTWSCTGGAGRRCTFDGGSSTDDVGIASHTWNFGDGTTATGVSATRRFASTGTFSVSLTVKDAAGLSNARTCAVQTGTSGSCPP